MLQNRIRDLGQFIPLHYHFQMLSDNNRMAAFSAAIKHVVKPNHRVVDLGSGTGVMSLSGDKNLVVSYSIKDDVVTVGTEKYKLGSYARKLSDGKITMERR